MMKTDIICQKKDCTGCYACYNACPVGAIKLEEDKYGNVYPKINLDKCIGCDKCRKTCPSLKTNLNLKYPLKCYAAYSKEPDINYNSSSGGIAYELGRYIIEHGGVYYAVSSYCDNRYIGFERIDSVDKLTRVQGSKYVHAYIKDTYKNIEKDLKDNKKVLFIATPCQVSGLKAYLNKDYNNLLLVDIVCHGVPSQKLLKQEINKKFDYVSFRQGMRFDLIAKNKKKIVYKKNRYTSKYYYLYYKGIINRECCYNCKYARNERVSDITIGDFWGLNDGNFKSKYGTSVVLINTYKGEIIDKIDRIIYKEKAVLDGMKHNSQLNKPINRTKEVEIFRKEYKDNLVDVSKRIYTNKDYKNIYVGTLKESIKKIIKR